MLVKAVVGLFILEAATNIVETIFRALEFKVRGTPESITRQFYSENMSLLDLSPLDLAVLAAGPAHTFSYIALVVFYCIWKNRSCKNSWMLNPDVMSTTPGWAVGWYFIPIMWFFKPFVAMREIRDASCSPGKLSVALPTWWTLWITSNVVSYIGARLCGQDRDLGCVAVS